MVSVEFISYAELLTDEGRNKLQFIDEDAYNRLVNFFDPTFYNGETKGTRFKQKGVTVRIASGYNQKSNRVYKNWNCNLDSDFGSVFFKKNQYNFGLLISNFPEDDTRNTVGQSGIKIITSGEREWRAQETIVQNDSMYSIDEVA